MLKKLFITGAGVSKDSGIPTFRGADGFWTIGSSNFTPQEMATRKMYYENPGEFLLWYYRRFASYRDVQPNEVHHWLANKNLITQNKWPLYFFCTDTTGEKSFEEFYTSTENNKKKA